MRLKNLSFSILLSLPLSAAAQTPAGFAELENFSASRIKQLTLPGLELPADKKWGVSYTLKGVLAVDEGRVLLNTADGRLFQLDLAPGKAEKFNGRAVSVEALARQADDLSILRVESITEYTPKAGEVVPPPYQPRRRQARLLSDKAGELVMDNVRTLRGGRPSDGSFDWTTASLRPELIKNVYFVKKPFAPEFVAAHSFFLFTFEPGGLRDGGGSEPAGLTLSIEGRTRVGQNFSPLTGLRNKFGIIWNLSTWEDYAGRTVLLEKGHLVPYPVQLSHVQKVQLLRESMALAAVDREGEFYHTITNNCTNNMLIIMNRVLPENRRIKMWAIPYMVYNVRATMPLTVIKNLQKKGLLGGEFINIDAATLSTRLP
ncbi:MAG: DUF4105 domain-containing protein [Elusimicrobiota bacterium]|nr:DUF4105 domain-containing protein [Elusimicrobiota bacterium]